MPEDGETGVGAQRKELSLTDVEERQKARAVLRTGYWQDVAIVADAFSAKVRAGHPEYTLHNLSSILFKIISTHPRVTEESLALETLAYSAVPDAITEWFPEEHFTIAPSEWTAVEIERHDEDSLADVTRFVLPSWPDLAFYAFFNDVSNRIYETLGDDPESYVATRLGIKWD